MTAAAPPTPSGGPSAHPARAARAVAVYVVTVSDTRTAATDTGGGGLARRLAEAGHTVLGHERVPDEVDAIAGLLDALRLRHEVEAIVLTGGTGLAPRDRTFEAVHGRLDKVLTGFGELFRVLSLEQVASAALASRAVAGLAGRAVVFSLPGSPAAVSLALERLILPELQHLVGLARGPAHRAAPRRPADNLDTPPPTP